jgi:hypothetical protein
MRDATSARVRISEETLLGESERLRTSGMLTKCADCARPRFSVGAFTWRENGCAGRLRRDWCSSLRGNREMRLEEISRTVSSALSVR